MLAILGPAFYGTGTIGEQLPGVLGIIVLLNHHHSPFVTVILDYPEKFALDYACILLGIHSYFYLTARSEFLGHHAAPRHQPTSS